MRPHPSAPQLEQPRAPHLPIDTPPRCSRLPQVALTGLSWEYDPGTIETPIGRPFTQYESPAFPLVRSSQGGPAAIRPKYGFSINRYSPVPHRGAAELMEHRPAVPAVNRRAPLASQGFRRVHGQVMPQPAVNQTWRNVFTGRMVD